MLASKRPTQSLTVRELDGSPTVAATELVLPNGTLTVAGSVATVSGLAKLDNGTDTIRVGGVVIYDPIGDEDYLISADQFGVYYAGIQLALRTANTFSGLQSFSGTDTPGLSLKSLTTTQIATLAGASALPVGSILRDSTTDRIDARLARGTVELIDSAGGQVVAGNLAVTTLMLGGSGGPLLRSNSTQIEARNNANTTSTNFLAATITAETSLRTNNITRNGVATIALFNAGVTSNFHMVTIGGGSLTNSSGISGELSLSSTVNQTGTAGSTNLLINRTETALGSGSHNFFDCQVSSTTRFCVTNQGAIKIGASGTVVATILSATATLDFPSIAANSFADLTLTVTGAVSGDTVIANPIAGSAITDVSYDAWVSASNTVTVRATNNSSTTARDPASGTFRATVIRF